MPWDIHGVLLGALIFEQFKTILCLSEGLVEDPVGTAATTPCVFLPLERLGSDLLYTYLEGVPTP